MLKGSYSNLNVSVSTNEKCSDFEVTIAIKSIILKLLQSKNWAADASRGCDIRKTRHHQITADMLKASGYAVVEILKIIINYYILKKHFRLAIWYNNANPQGFKNAVENLK